MVVSRLMYGAGAVVWTQSECDALERMQSDMGRWIWRAETSVRNACIRGETGWSTFAEREAKAKMSYMSKVVFGNGNVSEIGRACVMELGCKSRWWRRVAFICGKYGMESMDTRANLIHTRRLNRRWKLV